MYFSTPQNYKIIQYEKPGATAMGQRPVLKSEKSEDLEYLAVINYEILEYLAVIKYEDLEIMRIFAALKY